MSRPGSSRVRVLVVDDSSFYRLRITQILRQDPGIEIVGTAANGKQAVEQAIALRPDVITMDVEMPEMNGIEASREIMARAPTRILMFSALTQQGAKATLDALEAGAVDFIPKDFGDAMTRSQVVDRLVKRVLALGGQPVSCRPGSGLSRPRPASLLERPGDSPGQPLSPALCRPEAAPSAQSRASCGATGYHQLLAIGASTGGPMAIQTLLGGLSPRISVPVVIAVHMPANFTPAYAERLNRQCPLTVTQARDGDALRPGHVLLAPGGLQMEIEGRPGSARVRIYEGDSRHRYQPSVDLLLDSVARVYPGKALGVVLTGMGNDGLEGARQMKRGGSSIWVQDEASCVVYGMPAAIERAGLADKVLALSDISGQLMKVL